MRLLLTGLATLILAAPLLAGVGRADDCDKNQMTLNECAGKAFDVADKALNDTYRQISARLKDNTATKKLLVDAQKSWIAFRDSECTFQSSASVGGSIYPLLVANCRTGLTNDRVKQLKTYLVCQEGDMSCPVPAR